MPKGREWRSYLLRHSLATLARNRGATKWDLEGFMGHSDGSQTEVYAIGEFPSVGTALTGILADLEKLAPGAMHRSRTKQENAAAQIGVTKCKLNQEFVAYKNGALQRTKLSTQIIG